jgi:hypothetical protein
MQVKNGKLRANTEAERGRWLRHKQALPRDKLEAVKDKKFQQKHQPCWLWQFRMATPWARLVISPTPLAPSMKWARVTPNAPNA